MNSNNNEYKLKSKVFINCFEKGLENIDTLNIMGEVPMSNFDVDLIISGNNTKLNDLITINATNENEYNDFINRNEGDRQLCEL